MLKTYSKHLKAFTASDSFGNLESETCGNFWETVGNWAADIKVMIPETAILLRVQYLQQSLKWPGVDRGVRYLVTVQQLNHARSP